MSRSLARGALIARHRARYAVVLLVLFIGGIVACGALSLLVTPAEAAPAGATAVIICQSIGGVKLAPGIAGVNVRSEAAYGATIATAAIKPDTTYLVEAVSPDGRWYKLCASGWVARITESGTILLTFTAGGSPTRTATVAPHTPTRLPSSTPTEISILETAIADESYTVIPFYCDRACEGWIIVRPLP